MCIFMTNLIKFPDIEGAMVSCATVCTLHIGPRHHSLYKGPMAWHALQQSGRTSERGEHPTALSRCMRSPLVSLSYRSL